MKDPLRPNVAVGDLVTVRWSACSDVVQGTVHRLRRDVVALAVDHPEVARLHAGDLVTVGTPSEHPEGPPVEVPARVISMEARWRSWGARVVRAPTSLVLSRGVYSDGLMRAARHRHIPCDLPMVVPGRRGLVEATCTTLGPAGLVLRTDVETLPSSEIDLRLGLPTGWVELSATVLRRDAPRHAFAVAFVGGAMGLTQVATYVLGVLEQMRQVA